MEPKALLQLLHTAEKLKCTTRHCDTTTGRRESVAEHSWRLALMALLLKDEFPTLDMDRVIAMCLIHDLGECFTGDIPVFLKTDSDREAEDRQLAAWVSSMPSPAREDLQALYAEMDTQQTLEARVYKALDGLEALIQHNESDLSSWEPHEYQLQMTYCTDRVTFSPYLTALRTQIRKDTEDKVKGTLGDPLFPKNPSN